MLALLLCTVTARKRDKVVSASIDDLMAALAQAGIAIAKPPVQRSDGISLFVSDPDGCRVELIVKS